ncbi:M-phase inducer phosphatase 1 [Frankliniella fusca]|uniref:M-phase inducer phosphatase 1 n=1 Tax=Frankliniella fusca TaxID=407009 RepID=A0AAE1LKG6_9NEOP|nr:M-phase inducer phosphatase 1 [Frankliniella fusca]
MRSQAGSTLSRSAAQRPSSAVEQTPRGRRARPVMLSGVSPGIAMAPPNTQLRLAFPVESCL